MSNLRIWKFFKCERCGKCCENTELPLPGMCHEDYEAMAKYLNLTIEEMINKYYGTLTDDRCIVTDEKKRKPCPFLTKENGVATCLIYPVRPEGCRYFPFEIDGGRAEIDCRPAKSAWAMKAKEEREF